MPDSSDQAAQIAPPAPRTKLLVTRKDAAYTLSLSTRTVDQLIAAGEIDIVRIGHKVLIRAQSLDRLARSRAVPSHKGKKQHHAA